jgi:hypothetical protein
MIIIPEEYARVRDGRTFVVKKQVGNDIIEHEINGTRSDIYFIKVHAGLADGDEILRWTKDE